MYVSLAVLLTAFAQDFTVEPGFTVRLGTLESRVDAIEKRLDALAPTAKPGDKPALAKSYAEALARSIAENKPLVVWSGEALCAGCVASTTDEFSHWIGTLPGYPANALIVGLPESGKVWNIATMQKWPNGHLDAVRESIKLFRVNRGTVAAANQAALAWQASQSFGGFGGYGGGYSGKSVTRTRVRGGG